MSMPIAGTPDAADQAAADLAAADDATFPEWEAGFEANAIPEMLRPGLRDIARKQNAAAQKAIQQARGGGVDPQWQAFIGNARESGINPTDLVEAWNASQAIREDPLSFARDLNTKIAELQASGQITPAEAAQARVEGQAAITDALGGEPVNLKTEEMQRLEALEAQQTQFFQQQQAAQEQYQQQQVLAEAQTYAEGFRTELYTQLGTNGYTAEAGTLNDQIVGAVGRIAASALDGDQTGTLTPQLAIQTALQTLISISGGPKAVAQAPVAGAPQQFPVGGGRGAPAEQQPQKFDLTTREGAKAANTDREQRMLAEAAKIFAEG